MSTGLSVTGNVEERKAPVGEIREGYLHTSIGTSIRLNRLRSGMTQVQLARVISRSGKFLSEVESGKARITQRDLERLAGAMGISSEALAAGEGADGSDGAWDVPRRVRDVLPTGMAIMSFGQLVNYLDRAGWLRGSKLWMIGSQPFPEEMDVALVEQIASLVITRDVSLRYVFELERLSPLDQGASASAGGTLEALPTSLLRALRWSGVLQPYLDPSADRIIGYGVSTPLPLLCRCHSLLWVETEDVSWSDVMPLLYCRDVTRTFEKPNESTPFWYHLPRDVGSAILLEMANQLKAMHMKR